ncbi:hypothetical protein CVD28_03380 [Bacillus sp. M6-12]|uniref:hypothetical protein n=1 Tax=Bacillus sp. M6-12 TaxID=2054166 RepID=UPI000C777544|nr:hypothetical protein [Bacillus sp. M6-12]PLS19471.1 hypothetical protein CVD28_03380 [Bacillus sp. M6-12]
MMKTKVIACSTLLLLLSACSAETVSIESKTPTEKPVQLSIENPKTKETHQKEEKLPLIKALKKIEIGMKKEEVIRLMGESYKETSFMFTGEGGYSLRTPVPRINLDYSTGALVKGYVFETAFEDEVDIEGIYKQQRGDMIVIRLTDKEVVEQVFAIYLNKEEGKLYEYYKFPTKQVKDHVIYPYPTNE